MATRLVPKLRSEPHARPLSKDFDVASRRLRIEERLFAFVESRNNACSSSGLSLLAASIMSGWALVIVSRGRSAKIQVPRAMFLGSKNTESLSRRPGGFDTSTAPASTRI